jgi:hypothetical protein
MKFQLFVIGNLIIAKNNSNCLSKNFVIRKFAIANLIIEALLLVLFDIGNFVPLSFAIDESLVQELLLYTTAQTCRL